MALPESMRIFAVRSSFSADPQLTRSSGSTDDGLRPLPVQVSQPIAVVAVDPDLRGFHRAHGEVGHD